MLNEKVNLYCYQILAFTKNNDDEEEEEEKEDMNVDTNNSFDIHKYIIALKPFLPSTIYQNFLIYKSKNKNKKDLSETEKSKQTDNSLKRKLEQSNQSDMDMNMNKKTKVMNTTQKNKKSPVKNNKTMDSYFIINNK